MDKVWKWDDRLTPYQNFSYWLQLANEERFKIRTQLMQDENVNLEKLGVEELSFAEGKKIFEEMYEMKFDFTENDNE